MSERHYRIFLTTGVVVSGNIDECAQQMRIAKSTLQSYLSRFRRKRDHGLKKILRVEQSRPTIYRVTKICDEDCFNCVYPDCIWNASYETVRMRRAAKA